MEEIGINAQELDHALDALAELAKPWRDRRFHILVLHVTVPYPEEPAEV